MKLIRAKALMYLEGMKLSRAQASDLSLVARSFLALGIIYDAEAADFLEPKDRRKRNVPEFLKASVMAQEKRLKGDRRKC
jgi:hypothetical protein